MCGLCGPQAGCRKLCGLYGCWKTSLGQLEGQCWTSGKSFSLIFTGGRWWKTSMWVRSPSVSSGVIAALLKSSQALTCSLPSVPFDTLWPQWMHRQQTTLTFKKKRKETKKKKYSLVIGAFSPAVMFHPRCQKAHDFNMTSDSGEVRPRKFHHTSHPKEGSLISCQPACVVHLCVCVWKGLCGFFAVPSGVYEVTSQLVLFGRPHCLVLPLELSVREEW